MPEPVDAVEQDVAGAAVDDPRDRRALRLRQLRRLRLAAERLPLRRRRLLLAALRRHGRDERERARRRRAVVVGEPERELDERRRDLADDRFDRPRLDALRRRVDELRDDAARPRAAERHAHDRADADVVRHLVRERARDRPRGHERKDRRVRHYDSAGCSSARARRRSVLNESVRAISPIAITPSTRFVTVIAMFMPTLNASSSVREIAERRNR